MSQGLPILVVEDDPNLREGLNVHLGRVTYQAVAEALGYEYQPTREALKPWWAPSDH